MTTTTGLYQQYTSSSGFLQELQGDSTMISLCPLSAPRNLFCIDTLRFSGSLTSITFATYCWVCHPFSGRVMTYLFICLQSFCPLCAYQFFLRCVAISDTFQTGLGHHQYANCSGLLRELC